MTTAFPWLEASKFFDLKSERRDRSNGPKRSRRRKVRRAWGVRRDMKIMRCNDDRMPLTIQFLQKLYHLAAIGVVERSGCSSATDCPAVYQGPAMETRCCCPPDSSCGRCAARSLSPSRSNSAAARLRRSAGSHWCNLPEPRHWTRRELRQEVVALKHETKMRRRSAAS